MPAHGTSDTEIRFGILGPLEVTVSGRSVDVGGKKQRAVLASLLLEPNRVVSLDRLVDQLWAEQPPPSATGSLQAYVSNLRRILEPGRAPGARSRVLASKPPGYALYADPERIDALRFESLLAKARRELDERRARVARETLHEGLALWRGAALAEFASEAWARAEAARLEELRWTALETDIEARLFLGDHAAAIAQIEGLLGSQPLRERLWWHLMLALYRCGRQADALAAFRRARDVLADELGIDPSRELAMLEEQILRQAPDLAWTPPGDDEAAATASGSRVEEPHARTPDAFVGRETQLATLRKLVDATAGGAARLTTILGEAGIGKSRLAREAATHARGSGFVVGWGRCHEGEGAPPMWPWVQAFRELAVNGSSIAARLLTMMEQPSDAGHDQVMFHDSAMRGLLFESVAESLFEGAAQAPMLVVLDDLHWADVGSLQLLEFIVQQFHRARGLMILATYRDTDVEDDDPLRHTLAVLARAEAVHLRLEGLDDDEVGTMIQRALGDDPGARSVAPALRARTGGNPFFVQELLRLLESESGGRLAASVLTSAVPLGVRDVVRRRLARLPDAATSVLTLAAVEGREFEFSILQAVDGMELETLVNVVDAALITSLVEEIAGADGRYRFTHDLVRETLLERLSGARRARLHAALADAYVSTTEPTDRSALSRVAAHFWAAGTVTDAARALPFIVRAAEQALAQLAYEEAAELYGRALTLLTRIPGDPERLKTALDLHVRHGTALAITQGYASPAAGSAFERASDLASQLGESASLAGLWGSWAFVCVRADFMAARKLAHQMLELGAASGDRAMLALGHESAGITSWHLGEFDDALAHFDEAIARTDQLGRSDFRPMLQDPRISSRAFSAATLFAMGKEDEGWRRMSEARLLSGDDPSGRTFVLLFSMWAGPYLDDRDQARGWAEEGLEVATAAGFRLFEGLARAFRGWSRDDPEEVARGIEIVHRSGALMLQTVLYGLLAEASHRAGDEGAARRALTTAVEQMDQTGERTFAAQLERIAAEIGHARPHV